MTLQRGAVANALLNVSTNPVCAVPSVTVPTTSEARLSSVAVPDVIVGAVIALCSALGMTITAEGVETQQQLTYISKRMCTEAQGFLFRGWLRRGLVAWLANVYLRIAGITGRY